MYNISPSYIQRDGYSVTVVASICAKKMYFRSSLRLLSLATLHTHTNTNTPLTLSFSVSLWPHTTQSVHCAVYIYSWVLDSIALPWLFSSSMAIKAFIEVEKQRWINSIKYSFVSRFFGLSFIDPPPEAPKKWCNWPHTLGKNVRSKHQHDVRDVIHEFCLYVHLPHD